MRSLSFPASGLLVPLILLLAGAAVFGEAPPRGSKPWEDPEVFLRGHWQFPIPPQGSPPKDFSPAEASLEPTLCGACHPAQLQDWKESLHAKSMGPGVLGQLIDLFQNSPLEALECTTCHAPLAEQQPRLRTREGAVAENPLFQKGLDVQGLICAACHVRGHEHFGPPRLGQPLGPSPAKPPHGGVTRTLAFQTSEFCRPCHQHGQEYAVNGKPLENTYEEWRAGPYAEKGVQCQDCHMPSRRHLWRGIHDPEMTARAVLLRVEVARGAKAVKGRVVAEIELQNQGAGHYFPTYVTPAVFVVGGLLDASGKTIEGTERRERIQRQIQFTSQGAVELSDTRIPPGKGHRLSYNVPRPKGATHLRVYVEVFPDHFYTGFFESYLKGDISPKARELIQRALDNTRKSPFLLYDRTLPLP